MTLSLSIECKVYPFGVPHFTTEGSTENQFPTKADLLIADIDGDGVITEADKALWTDTFAVDLRLMNLVKIGHPDYKDGDEFSIVWDDDWWQSENIVIWATFESNNVTLTWTDDWELALVLPESMISLQISLLFLGLNQKRLMEHIAAENNKLVELRDFVNANSMSWFKTTSTYKNLVKRIEHVNDTYVRL